MDVGGNLSQSSSQNNSAINNDISETQKPYLQDMWGQAQQWVGDNQGEWQKRLQEAERGMYENSNTARDLTNQNLYGANAAYQNQLGGGAYQDMDLAKNLSGSLQQSMNSPSAMQDINSMIMGGAGNNYADAMKSQYINDANSAQQNMLANMDARAAASGMSGGSRHGVLQGMGMENINSNLQSQLAQTGFNTFDKDLDRKLNIAQQADQGTLARQGMMQNMLGQQNAASTGALANLQQQNQGMQGGMDQYQQYQNNLQGNFLQQQQPLTWLSGIIGSPQMSTQGFSSGSGNSFGMGGGLGVGG